MFCRKVYLRFFGFLIPHISHNSNVSFSSLSLLIDQTFKAVLPRFASKEASNNRSKSPANITLWLWMFTKLDSIVFSSLRTLTCSFSVLALWIFISKKSESSIRASKTMTRPFLQTTFFNCYVLVTIESYQNSTRIRWTMRKV